MRELDRVARLSNRPLARVGDLVGVKLPKRRLIGPAQRAHSDLDERLAGLGLLIPQAAAAGKKLLHRPLDRVMNFWVVPVEPLSEVGVPVPFQTRNYARPVEARAAIISIL